MDDPLKILVVEYDAMLLASEVLLLRSRCYAATPADCISHASIFLSKLNIAALIIGHSVPRDDREGLVVLCRHLQSQARILVLHSSGKEMVTRPDAAVDSREGPALVLNALDALLGDFNELSAPRSAPSPQAKGKTA